MLTHKNLTAMAAKMSSVFTPVPARRPALACLPLHHTFEFSAGFLMPLVYGSSITYLEEVDADNADRRAGARAVTSPALIGVPALWQLVHRKIFKRFVNERRPARSERAFESIVSLSRVVREKTGVQPGHGKVPVLPRAPPKLGGRLRLAHQRRLGPVARAPRSRSAAWASSCYEGYGMTESAPVHHRAPGPSDTPLTGSGGPGACQVWTSRSSSPTSNGIGEVHRQGPQRHGRLPREPRGHGRRCCGAAGCTRVTSDAWTRTATSSSSAARRR